ncbi:hypothetical protein ACROYT_G032478 [Oculina patagonica]
MDPGNIHYGQRKHDGFELGKPVEYRCLPGFTMQGSNILTCTRTGAWDKVKPNCTCERTNKKAYLYCAKQCNSDSGCSRDSQCVCDGDCGYSCVPKEIICKDPGNINNGIKQIFQLNYDKDYVAVRDVAAYNCFPGYKMEGSKYLSCTKSGKWSQAKPKCVLASCDPPKVPDNSEIRGSKKPSYKYLDKVFLKCKPGYFTIGMGLLTCGSDGWTSRSFTCYPRTCGSPGNLRNGKVKSYNFAFKSKVYFECHYGYKLVGDKYRLCHANQRWGGKLPTCERKDVDIYVTLHVLPSSPKRRSRQGGCSDL